MRKDAVSQKAEARRNRSRKDTLRSGGGEAIGVLIWVNN